MEISSESLTMAMNGGSGYAPSRGLPLIMMMNLHNTFGDWGLANAGPYLWNSLPVNYDNGTVQMVAEYIALCDF